MLTVCQGGTIELLFFPPGLTPATNGPVIATTLNTTLTSPTLYISLASVYASDGCGGVGPTKAATIIPIPSDQLSSSWNTVSSESSGPFAWECALSSGIASFNVTDLASTPVPYSIYESQQYCANLVMAPEGYCSAPCPTTLPYNPIVVVDTSVLDALDPAWATCYLDLRGLYDPPKRLTPVTAIAGPSITAPHASTTISATPASGPTSQSVAANTSPVPSSASPVPITKGLSSSPEGDSAPADPSQNTQATSSNAATSPAGQSAPESPPQAGQASNAGGSPQDPGSANGASTQAADPAPQIISVLQATATHGASLADPAAQILSSALDTFTPQPGPSGGSGDSTINSGGAVPPPTTPAAVHPASDPSAALAGGLAVNGHTLLPGDTGIVDGQSVSVGSGYAVFAGSLIHSPSTPSTVVIAGQTYEIGPAQTGQAASPTSGLVVNGQTILRGQTGTINGQPVSVGKGYAVIAGSTITSPSTSITAVVAGQTYEVGPAESGQGAGPALPSASGLVINGQTLLPGETETVNGESISVGNGYVVIAGSTITSPLLLVTAVVAGQTFAVGPAGTGLSGPSGNPGTVFTYDGSKDPAAATAVTIDPSFIITATPGQPVVVAGQTIVPGGAALTVSGYVLSEIGTELVIDGTRTVDLDTAYLVGTNDNQAGNEAFTTTAVVGDQVFTIVESLSGQDALVDGIAVSVGGSAVVIDGQTVSAVPGSVDVGGSFIAGISGGIQHSTPVTESASITTPNAANTGAPGIQSANGAASIGATTIQKSGTSTAATLEWIEIIVGLLFAVLAI